MEAAAAVLLMVVVGLVMWWREKRQKTEYQTNGPRFLPGTGEFSVEVKGESHYQANLEAICGPRKRNGENLSLRAQLVYEPNNPADRNAVRVEIAGRQVGYLSRDNAVMFRRQLSRAVECNAVIRGGWQRKGEDVGHYGVWLDIPTK